MQNDIPTISLEKCEYNKASKVLTLSSEYIGMPKEFYVKSHITGRTILFVAVNSENALYKPLEKISGVDHLIIYQLLSEL